MPQYSFRSFEVSYNSDKCYQKKCKNSESVTAIFEPKSDETRPLLAKPICREHADTLKHGLDNGATNNFFFYDEADY